jgi:hypothetical protein
VRLGVKENNRVDGIAQARSGHNNAVLQSLRSLLRSALALLYVCVRVRVHLSFGCVEHSLERVLS